MVEENISQELGLKNIDKTRNYFVQERDQNELMGNKHKKVCTTPNYIEHFLTLVFAVTVCIFIFDFPSSVDMSMGIMSSTIG